ncbi:MAG TPA: PfkB family carbohydrate kinase, partial [Steroidobacteraceae bacterium]|nr:PfkB family carbohydrate kinase [Steroidobacteraceae bacterium]
VRVAREEERLGGAANVALNIKSLGAHASLMTVVGTDEPAGKLRKLLNEHGVHALLGSDAQLNTIVKLRVIGRAQQLIRLDFENQPDHEVLALMLSEYQRVLPEHDAVLFSDYGKGGLTHIPRMITLARQAKKPVLIDPKGNDYARYAGATVITPNREELAQVIGAWSSEAQLHERVQQLRQAREFGAVLLTRSGEGISLFDEHGHLQVPALAREVFDVTGAGDTVIAVLAVLLACGVSLREALPVVNRAGGIVVGKFGAANLGYEELFP